MGGAWSAPEREPSPDPWWGNVQAGTSNNVPSSGESADKTEERARRKVNQEEMDAFKKEIARKRELRRAAIASVQSEMRKLKADLADERARREAAEDERDRLAGCRRDAGLSGEVERLKRELEEERTARKDIEAVKDTLQEKEGELEAVEQQVKALKEVASIGREMLRIRELQVNELKRKLQEIEVSMPTAPEDLRLEYESQIQNIRRLRTLYEERASATRQEHRQERERDAAKINVLEAKVNELQEEIQEHKDKNAILEIKLTKTEETVEEKITELESLQDQLRSSTVECRSLKSQMKIINHLFSQALSGPEFDLDRLTRLLKENHGLITDLTATGDSNEVAALLLDIAEKAEGDNEIVSRDDDERNQTEENLRKEKEEIASNLSKVWRVLVELLSHHKDVGTINAGAESCYKSVDTPSGPRLVISVSQTFLTLKDLILEKNSLVKEVGRLKTLNGHLETRMHSQERRLSTVSTELKKTWSVVSKLRAQHKQLHNHEKILRYELQHKRQMLSELKQELEHCREKWDSARQKNTQSEEDWKQLRKEFASRKTRKLSNSAESGFEEEDSHSSPSEGLNEPHANVPLKQDNSEISEDLSEEEVEPSDGNSYETVIDLLDIACLESHIENETNTEVISLIEQDATMLNNEFAQTLNQIDLDSENNPTPDFTSPFPSSSSSPIPTETEDLLSETDVSEEIPRSVSPFHQFHFTEEPINVPEIPQDNLYFGSNSAQNVSRFLEGLIFTDIANISESSNEIQHNQSEINTNEALENHALLVDPQLQPTLTDTVLEVKEIQSISQYCAEQEEDTTESINVSQQTELNSEETNALPLDSTSKMLNLKYIIPKILVITENESETLETTDDLGTNLSDNECVANAIHLCLQDVQISNPNTAHSEVETTEVNNNVPDGTALDDNTETDDDERTDFLNATTKEENIKDIESSNRTENESVDAHEPSTSGSVSENHDGTNKSRTPQEILEARAARLKRLEEQCKSLFSKMSATSKRSDVISNRLDEMHEHYGPSQSATKSNAIPSMSTDLTDKATVENSSQILDSGVLKRLNEPSSSADPCCTERLEVTDGNAPRSSDGGGRVLDARAERSKRLEEQCKSSRGRVTKRNDKGNAIRQKLQGLHRNYGSSELSTDTDAGESLTDDSESEEETS